MQILNYITLDFSRPNVAMLDYAVQGDEYSRGVVAQLVGGSQAWTPPSGAGGFIEYVRADGAPGLYDTLEDGTPAVTVSGSTATLLFSAHALQVSGTLSVALRFVDSAGTKLRSFEFPVNVKRELVSDDEIIQTPYFNILTQQIAQAVDAAARAEAAAASITLKGYTSVTQLGLTSGSATIAEAYAALPRGSTLACSGNEFAASERPGSALNCVIFLFKSQQGPARGSVFAQTIAGDIWTMGVSASAPTGVWKNSKTDFFPIGYILISASATNPGTIFGGTWTRITGKFLLAATDGGAVGGNNTANVRPGGTGGVAEVRYQPTGSVGEHALTVEEMPSHLHRMQYYNASGDVNGGYTWQTPGKLAGMSQTASGMAPTGGGKAHTHELLMDAEYLPNMSPYIAVYMWQRTA